MRSIYYADHQQKMVCEAANRLELLYLVSEFCACRPQQPKASMTIDDLLRLFGVWCSPRGVDYICSRVSRKEALKLINSGQYKDHTTLKMGF